VKTYSSGMFARLAFACAINVDPDILIVDEVLSVGDMAFQLKCFKKFEEFKKSGKTIIFVTHNVADVLRNCNRAIILENGKKTFDGSVKEGVNKYKKIIVGLSDSEIKKDEKLQEEVTISKKIDNSETWKNKLTQNPNLTEYGNGQAEVIDYGVFDKNGELVSIIDNGDTVTLKSKIEFYEDVKDPIFTMTVKDFNGNDIAGTNSEIEKIMTGNFKKGDIVVAEFVQRLPIQVGKYTLSFSCTKVNVAGELEVLSRKYDALLIEVITTKPTVGTVRLDSQITIQKIN
jgi:teichoic acid transport system ATP-binding protein